MRLILVRHGETEWNREYRVMGRMNLSLNQYGKMQAARIGCALEHESIEAIYASSQLRALETAEAIGRKCLINITTLEGLRELDVGELDGIHSPDMKTLFPEFYIKWTTDAANTRPPGGETLQELQDRVWASVQQIMARDHKNTVVIVSHFFALLALFCKVLSIGLSDFRRLGLSVASISALEFSGGKFRLVWFNHVYHLNGGPDQDGSFPSLKARS